MPSDQPITREQARKVHIALNVAIHRVGGAAPACDGDACEVCEVIIRELLAQVQGDGWQPIETAPKDADVLLLTPARGVVRGRWQTDRYA